MNDMKVLLPHLRLRFNIEHPNFEECYTYGYECALAEISELDNPYPLHSKESEQWLEGWWAGFYGEEPLYQLVLNDANPSESSDSDEAANDQSYADHPHHRFFIKFMEITGMLAVSAAVGYQVIDLLVA